MTDPDHKSYLEASLAATKQLLNSAHEWERIGLKSRIEELEGELEQVKVEPRAAVARIYFGGAPVVDSQGIDIRFASESVASYQDLVAKLGASRQTGTALPLTGPVPDLRDYRLHITNVVRGSFGFEVREVSEAPSAALAETVRETSAVLRALKSGDEPFAELELDPRVQDALGSFMTTMKKAGASLRVRSGDDEVAFSEKEVEAAAARVTAVIRDVNKETVRGRFLGALLASRAFEFRVEGSGEVIRGKADPALELEPALSSLANKECEATVRVTRMKRGETILRSSYVLLLLTPNPPQ